VHPNIPGAPWWGAVLIAVAAAAVGFAFDAWSGNKELTSVFAGLYVLGCVAAVLAVRQSGVFTAVIQPPLILFVAVPTAYWLFHGSTFTGIKDALINYGYPLIERFPLMLFASAGVLLIGMARWYFGMAGRVAAVPNASATKASAATAGQTARSRFAAITTRLSSIWAGDAGGEEGPSRRHAVGRPTAPAKPTRAGGPSKRPAPTRSRHARPPVDDISEPVPERQRHRRPAHAMGFEAPPDPRRRPRPARDPGQRNPPPREFRRDPPERRDPYQRPAARSGRFDPYEPYEPPPPRRRPAPNGSNGTHHPISRVRYRGAGDEPGGQRASGIEDRNREAQRWEYDS